MHSIQLYLALVTAEIFYIIFSKFKLSVSHLLLSHFSITNFNLVSISMGLIISIPHANSVG